MARAGPKSRKGKAAPKSKKEVVKAVEESSEEEEVKEEENEEEVNNETDNGAGGVGDEEEEEDDEEPPAKKGRGRPAAAGRKSTGKKAAASPASAKKGGRAGSRGRKTPAAKKETIKKKDDDDESEDDEKEYEVEHVIDVKNLKGGKRAFLIKWKGYSKKVSSWEPEDNLNCEEAIKEFEKKREEQKKNPGAETRPMRKQTERYADIAGRGDESRRRHSKRQDTRSPRKSYREVADDD